MSTAELEAAIDRLVMVRQLALDLAALRWSGELAGVPWPDGLEIPDVNEVLATTTAALLEGRREALRPVTRPNRRHHGKGPD
jgi:hypothetical protein